MSGQIYTEQRAGETAKSAAQGLITLATYGVGMLVGFWLAGQITESYKLEGGGHNWQQIWIIPAAIAGGVMLLFGIFFKGNQKAA